MILLILRLVVSHVLIPQINKIDAVHILEGKEFCTTFCFAYTLCLLVLSKGKREQLKGKTLLYKILYWKDQMGMGMGMVKNLPLPCK